jgi:4-hydroxy-2-oxoheptanedioate aldolase
MRTVGSFLIGVVILASPMSGMVTRQAAQPRATPDTSPTGRLNQIIEQFEKGRPAFTNGVIMYRSTWTPAAAQPTDNEHWSLIEMEHGPYLIDEIGKILADLRPPHSIRPRLTPVVRIPLEADEVVKSLVKQVLDTGVMGIIAPHVETKEQMTRFVQAMRYPPQRGARYSEPVGVRGWAPFRAVQYWGLSQLDYAKRADVWPLNPEGELLAIAMIESREGVQNIDEILQVPGVGAVLIGPSDLSLSLGVGTPAANPAAPEVEAATQAVLKACLAHKVACGTFGGRDVKSRVAEGFRLFPSAAGNYR